MGKIYNRSLKAEEIVYVSITVHTIYGDFEIQSHGDIKDCIFDLEKTEEDIKREKYLIKVPKEAKLDMSMTTNKGFNFITTQNFQNNFKNALDKERQESYNKDDVNDKC